MTKSGYDIAAFVDPNISDDVCTFCVHANWSNVDGFMDAPICALGHQGYFRSISDYGPIFVSDCEAGELRPEFAAVDTAHD